MHIFLFLFMYYSEIATQFDCREQHYGKVKSYQILRYRLANRRILILSSSVVFCQIYILALFVQYFAKPINEKQTRSLTTDLNPIVRWVHRNNLPLLSQRKQLTALYDCPNGPHIFRRYSWYGEFSNEGSINMWKIQCHYKGCLL